ncbi:MAG: EAL domain-containing protein, partial [Rubrobacter sp.]|nr:EAL domain-containing protein [Rubrobacter sp.]
LMLGGHEAFITASVGIALGTSSKDRPEALVRQADIAMYEAKNKGKAHYRVFKPHMYTLALERLSMGSDLRRAIKREEFEVYYQPKVALETSQIVGMEALVRWERPKHGLTSPARFIPIAEELGLILPLGRWILEEACRQTRKWNARRHVDPPLTVCINLSAKQFEHPDLVQDVDRILQETGLNPRSLDLEITESAVMENTQFTLDTFRDLKALGVRLVIDDFGTGYSSLSYLKYFPVDQLKIGRSFIKELGKDARDAVLLSGIINLARDLGLGVIAEGVESVEQIALLQEMGCNFAQGYYFGRPLPSEEAGKLLIADFSWRSRPA